MTLEKIIDLIILENDRKAKALLFETIHKKITKMKTLSEMALPDIRRLKQPQKRALVRGLMKKPADVLQKAVQDLYKTYQKVKTQNNKELIDEIEAKFEFVADILKAKNPHAKIPFIKPAYINFECVLDEAEIEPVVIFKDFDDKEEMRLLKGVLEDKGFEVEEDEDSLRVVSFRGEKLTKTDMDRLKDFFKDMQKEE